MAEEKCGLATPPQRRPAMVSRMRSRRYSRVVVVRLDLSRNGCVAHCWLKSCGICGRELADECGMFAVDAADDDGLEIGWRAVLLLRTTTVWLEVGVAASRTLFVFANSKAHRDESHNCLVKVKEVFVLARSCDARNYPNAYLLYVQSVVDLMVLWFSASESGPCELSLV